MSGLCVSFGRRTVLGDLSFELARGSTLAVIGPNGAGKTVLFKAEAALGCSGQVAAGCCSGGRAQLGAIGV